MEEGEPSNDVRIFRTVTLSQKLVALSLGCKSSLSTEMRSSGDDDICNDEQIAIAEIRALGEDQPSPLLNFGSPSRARPSALKMALREAGGHSDAAAAMRTSSWDEELASIMGGLLLDSCDAKDATAAMEMMAHKRSQQLK